MSFIRIWTAIHCFKTSAQYDDICLGVKNGNGVFEIEMNTDVLCDYILGTLKCEFDMISKYLNRPK